MDGALLQEMVDRKYVRVEAHPALPHLRIFNYTEHAQFDREWNQVTRASARGLIVNIHTGEGARPAVPQVLQPRGAGSSRAGPGRSCSHQRQDGRLAGYHVPGRMTQRTPSPPGDRSPRIRLSYATYPALGEVPAVRSPGRDYSFVRDCLPGQSDRPGLRGCSATCSCSAEWTSRRAAILLSGLIPGWPGPIGK